MAGGAFEGGQVTSGANGYYAGKSLAIYNLMPDLAKPGGEVSVAILGSSHWARLLS
jgi:dimethylglycine dehydrogenase